MRTNVAAVNAEQTHEGGRARKPVASQQLVRQVATCMLFENTFYEKGSDIADGIAASCRSVPVEEIARVAVQARNDFKLRHVPLFLLAQMNERRTESPGLLARTVAEVVQRPDEMTELLSIVQKVRGEESIKKVLSHGLGTGLAKAFRKFSAYQLAKWNRDAAIKLRDVLFLCHPKPKDEEQAVTWKKLVDGSLESPDTWEVALSSGKDKRETWERLIREERLGYMALLMNLRNMEQAKVEPTIVEKALLDGAQGSRALPFRFVSAAKAAPSYAQALSDAMVKALSSTEKLPGTTCLVLDVSGSMDEMLSNKGTLSRWEAGAALGVLLREVCESARVFTFSNALVEVANLRGLAMIDGVARSQPHGGTYLAATLKALFAKHSPSRVIVVTDEQAHDGIVRPPAGTAGYLVNVAPYAPALELSGGWTRISGFSERLVDFVRWEESQPSAA